MKETARCLIVNADDFGLSAGVNDGIAEAHERGILTSASLMVRWPGARDAAAYARLHPTLSVGLHLDLGEWIYKEHSWQIAYQVVSLEDSNAVAQEVVRQFHQFRELMGREPTHADSHQHVHESEPVRSLVLKEAQGRGIPLRNSGGEIRYCGSFYGQSNTGYAYPQGVSVEGLLQALKTLESGVTELGCHPAKRADMEGMYREERVIECRTLCHPEVRAAIAAHNISLRSFLDWRDERQLGAG